MQGLNAFSISVLVPTALVCGERPVCGHHFQVSGTFASVIPSKPRPPILFKMVLFCLQLLDDNRELFIPETQDTVVAHPMFMLFATQNPPGHYGGRKVHNVYFFI